MEHKKLHKNERHVVHSTATVYASEALIKEFEFYKEYGIVTTEVHKSALNDAIELMKKDSDRIASFLKGDTFEIGDPEPKTEEDYNNQSTAALFFRLLRANNVEMKPENIYNIVNFSLEYLESNAKRIYYSWVKITRSAMLRSYFENLASGRKDVSQEIAFESARLKGFKRDIKILFRMEKEGSD